MLVLNYLIPKFNLSPPYILAAPDAAVSSGAARVPGTSAPPLSETHLLYR